MDKQETLSYEEQYRDESVSFSPFALWDTGLVPTQTVLRVDTYTLICAPYQFSMKKGALLCSLSDAEIAFFQRFKNSLAGLGIAFQRSGERESTKVFCRCQIEAVGKMKDRENLGVFLCAWKPIPPDLARLLGEHFLCVERLRLQYGDYRDKMIQMSPDTARKLGYNNYAMFTGTGEPLKLAIYSIAVNRVEFLLPPRYDNLVPGTTGTFALYFQRYRFLVKGTIESAERLPSGVQRAKAAIDFSPELVQLLEEYFYALHKAR